MSKKISHVEETLIAKWQQNIYNNSDVIDPDNERDWFDLAYGYFLGLGCGSKDAYKLAIETMNRNFL